MFLFFFLFDFFFAIQQWIEGKGFHIWNNINVNLKNQHKAITLYQPITNDFFVDKFEVMEKTNIFPYKKNYQYKISIVDEKGVETVCDIEAASYSKKIKKKFLKINIKNIERIENDFFLKIRIPFHIRYSKPSREEKYTKIIFPSCYIFPVSFSFQKQSHIIIPIGKKNFFIKKITTSLLIINAFCILIFLLN